MAKGITELMDNCIDWANERGLVKPENAPKQFMKFIEESGELSQAIVKQKTDEIEGEFGDVLVTLAILSSQIGVDPTDALQKAYDKISKRPGKTVDGIFIKD